MKSRFIIFLSFFTFSCISQNSDFFQIDPYNIKDNKISLSEIADDIQYIPLHNYYPIGHISFLKLTSKSIFIYEPRYGLLAFDKNGKKGKKIGDFGRGPGEYTYILSFAVDPNSEKIYVMSSDKRIDVYSRNGTFIRNIPLKKYGGNFQDIEVYNSNIFVSEYINAGQAKYNWIIIDSLGTLLNSKKNSVFQFSTGMVGGGGLYKFKNTISYWNLYNDTVFKILPDLSIKPTIIFKPGKFRIPRSNFSLEQYALFFTPYVLYETNRFLVVQYVFYQKITIALIDKESKKSYVSFMSTDKDRKVPGYKGGILNNLDGGLKLIPQYYYSEGEQEYLVGILNSSQLLNYVSSIEFSNSFSEYPEKKKKIKRLTDTLDITSNPIIVKVKLKKYNIDQIRNNWINL